MKDELIVAIDGEGRGRRPHRYCYLAAADEHGELYDAVEDPQGLTTRACLDWLCDLPARRLFAFSFGYDLAKLLQDLPDAKLYELAQEKLRAYTLPNGRVAFRSVYWAGFKLNLLNRKFTVQRVVYNPLTGRSRAQGRPTVVWDVFRFYAARFTRALADWNITTQAELDAIAAMKAQRSTFDAAQWPAVKRYCQSECFALARLVRKLIDAHKAADLELSSFYGAGSTASVLLDKLAVLDHRGDPPVAMHDALARSFFGGRFECAWRGPVAAHVHNRDIASAYPYGTTFLPCLVHGRWSHVTGGKHLRGRIERARLALVRAVPRGTDGAWGPLPWRSPDGTILFPLASPGVWVWKEEALTAAAHWPVNLKEAWVYDTDCDCRPFARVPEVYRERCRLGKEGAGKVLKLGANSIYGKLAQSKGQPKFNSWVWAANITSECRAQLLDAIATARDPWSVLMVATDGVWSTERLALPAPRDTGTADVVDQDGKPKPALGAWEESESPRGVFLCRPGIYFPRHPTAADLKLVRSRGITASVLLDHAAPIERWYERTGRHAQEPTYRITGLVRFVGLKGGVSVHEGQPRRRATYGEWVDHPIELSFAPKPKRPLAVPNGSADMLLPWSRPPLDVESAPYNPATKSLEGMALVQAEQDVEDSADGDYCLA